MRKIEVGHRLCVKKKSLYFEPASKTGATLTKQTFRAYGTDYHARDKVTHKSTERDDDVVCIHVH